jgi:HEAT repeat protein
LQDLQSLLSDLTSRDDDRAEGVVPALLLYGESALKALFVLLDDESADKRWWAVRALAEFDAPKVGESLSQALTDPDQSVRQCAAVALRHHPTPDAIILLIEALNNEDRLYARLSGDALTAIGKPAIPALTQALQSVHPSVRVEATRALALMELPETIPILFDASEDPSTMVQHWIDEGLNRLGLGMVFFEP